MFAGGLDAFCLGIGVVLLAKGDGSSIGAQAILGAGGLFGDCAGDGCGVLPAVLMYLQGKYHYSDLRMAHALGVAGIIGNLIRRNASISGAECGCQAEIGSACSMAAAAMCELMEFPIEQIEYAAEIAMEHHLGLTCDPICGLVQIPCIERNAVAAKRAIDSANLAHMLVGTRTISFDMVVRTMYETGISMNRAFRETSEGGLAKLYSRRAGQTLGK